MRAITWIALLVVLVAGCSGHNPPSVRDVSKVEVMPDNQLTRNLERLYLDVRAALE